MSVAGAYLLSIPVPQGHLKRIHRRSEIEEQRLKWYFGGKTDMSQPLDIKKNTIFSIISLKMRGFFLCIAMHSQCKFEVYCLSLDSLAFVIELLNVEI